MHLGSTLGQGTLVADDEAVVAEVVTEVGETPVAPVPVTWEYPGPAGAVVETAETPEVSVAVTGHTVVETAMVEVTTMIEFVGQLATVGAQSEEVMAVVVYTVDVVSWTGVTVFVGDTEVFGGAFPITEVVQPLV
jgi:hypothetical protein